jgi:ketoreductase
MRIDGKTALITGGSAGIGKAIAHKLGEEGARIAICGRSQERLEGAVSAMSAAGIEVLQAACDVRKLKDVEQFVDAAVTRYGTINILVNNVGAIQETPLTEANDEAWHRILQTVLDGTYYFTSRVLKYMPDDGRIVNISGVLGKVGVPGSTAYCAAKHGLIGFARAAALELAPRGITVNTVCPGWVDTDLAREVMEGIAAGVGMTYDEVRRDALGRVPLGQMIQPEEIASLVHFLVSSAGANITGQAYNISGGQVMH